jgi:hypothetical protein
MRDVDSHKKVRFSGLFGFIQRVGKPCNGGRVYILIVGAGNPLDSALINALNVPGISETM